MTAARYWYPFIIVWIIISNHKYSTRDLIFYFTNLSTKLERINEIQKNFTSKPEAQSVKIMKAERAELSLWKNGLRRNPAFQRGFKVNVLILSLWIFNELYIVSCIDDCSPFLPLPSRLRKVLIGSQQWRRMSSYSIPVNTWVECSKV